MSVTAATDVYRGVRRQLRLTFWSRITIAFVLILAVTLIFTGFVSYALVRDADASNARNLVLQQTESLARSAQTLSSAGKGEGRLFAELLPLVASVAGFKEGSVLEATPPAKLISANPPLDIGKNVLRAGLIANDHPTSGVSRGIAYAAVPLFTAPPDTPHGKRTVVALYLARLVGTSVASVSYFLLAGGISLVAAAVAAAVVTRRVSRRVVDAAVAARRIAGGDLSTRLDPSRSDVGEIETLRVSLNQMAARLEDLRDLDRQFLLAVSHDLRTPLTSILGYSEAIVEGEVDDPVRAARVVVGEANRLERLIGDLLDLARLDAHQFTLNLYSIDASSAVAQAAAAHRYAAEAAGVALDVDASDPSPIIGDRDRIAQIVSNLIENALRFAQHRVEVRCEPTSDAHVVVSVTDDGPGVAEEDRPRLFERHYSSIARPGRSAGTGLGLAIVAELVDQMHGAVEIVSPIADGHGARFEVKLPADPRGIVRDKAPSLAI